MLYRTLRKEIYCYHIDNFKLSSIFVVLTRKNGSSAIFVKQHKEKPQMFKIMDNSGLHL